MAAASPRTVTLKGAGPVGERLGDGPRIKPWVKPRVDPPKDFSVEDVQKRCPLDPQAPPLTIDAADCLRAVAAKCEGKLGQATPSFRRFFKQHILSRAVQDIMVSTFWFCCVELFEASDEARAEHNGALHDRLARAFATFCWGVEPSQNKDFFLQ